MGNDYNDIFEYRFMPYIPFSITNETVSVQPMTEPNGELLYMDISYNKKEFKFFRGYGV